MKNPHAQALGRLGGLARAMNLTAEQRHSIARLANKSKAAKKARKILTELLKEEREADA